MAGSRWSLLHARLHQTLKERQLLPKHGRSLIAVSGGQDSLCLMQLLLDLQPKWEWQLAIAHCNHRWRSDADANAKYVEQLAQNWQVPYYEATAPELCSSEAAARTWRYQALADIAIAHGYDSVVTGHTASDRAETLLYNLLRGSGTDGLQALTWRRELVLNVWLVRPLLDLTRTETAVCCQEADLDVWEDSTNQNWQYARNRIRQELFPYLKTHFNPQVEQAIAQTAELLRADVDCLEAMTAQLYQQVVVMPLETEGANPPRKLHRPPLRTAPLALQRRVMRQWLHTVLPIAPHFEHIEKGVRLITAPNRSQTDPFPGGAVARVENEWIVIHHL